MQFSLSSFILKVTKSDASNGITSGLANQKRWI